MHLKQLTVRGFKSFASATTFRFEPGVTAVVGPNGSGKSNVVDALAWVMGEQGAKNLRGGKMDDVIFAGTVSRPPLGRAQVTLTIDNTDGSLPIEYSEVTISRTLFRSGGSEYSINDRPCRLLDIQELLSDSGLGREMHVIVGQGQLDRVLHATAEDRRGLIEEAAGVLKHRRRREKAYRKLQSTDANLARLSDLTGEVARALKPLERQARVARRARDIQFELKDAQSRLAADSLATARAQEQQTRARLSDVHALHADTQRRADDADAALPALRDALTAAQREADSAQQRFAEARRAVEKLGVVLELAQSRAASLHGQEATQDAAAEVERLRAQLVDAEQDELTAAAALDEARAELETRRQAAEATARVQREADAVLAQRQREQAQAREELLRVKGAAEAVSGRVAAARSELERAQALADDAAAAETQAHRTLADLQETSVDGDSTASPENETASAVSSAVARRTAAEKALVTARQQARDAHARATSERSREQTLASTLESMASARPSSEPAAALFSEGLRVTSEDAGAIGALLHDDAVLPALAPTETETPAVWSEPVSTTTASSDGALPQLARWAQECASHDHFPDTLRELLAGAVVVPDQRSALEILRQEPAVRLAVTRDGLVVTRTGQRRPLDGRINAVDLAAQLRQVKESAAEAEQAAEGADRETERREAELAAARDEEQKARAEHSAAEQRRAVREAAVAAAQSAVQQARTRAEKLHTAAEQSAARLESLLESQAEAVRRVELLEDVRGGSDAEVSLDELRAARDEAVREADDARALHTEASVAVRGADERHRALRSRRADLETSLARGEKNAAAQAVAERRRTVLLARAERVAELAALARDQAVEMRGTRQTTLDETQRQLAQARRHFDEQSRAGAELTATLTQAAAEAATLEAHLVHETQRCADLEQQSLEQLGLSPDELLRRFGPDVPLEDGGAFDRSEQEKRLRTAQTDMQALGKVNPLALEEFAALEQRHTFLSTQLADLRGSRGDLLKIIKDVDETIERVFAAAYEDTAREFVGVFSRLFPGGEGSLELTEPDDLLSSGLEVNARPAGKKVKRLSLLSGGERSLTAIALLVAIFKARPSPFYVMDEVEAALDDANLGRLIGLFEELRESSQLIIVTHQKRTMEVADALYGVSMRGDGVSLVISEKVARPDEDKTHR